jgi:hypothetical protein
MKKKIQTESEKRARDFEAWAASHRPTTPLSDHAVRREAMYEDEVAEKGGKP